MIKPIDDKDIESIRYLKDISENSAKLSINGLCKKKQLTAAFLSEFSNYITNEAFSESANLTYDLVEKYPEKFDIEIWKKSNKRSLELLKNREFRKQLTTDEIVEILNSVDGFTISDELYGGLVGENDKITSVLLKKYRGNLLREGLEQNASEFTADSFKNPKMRSLLSQDFIEKIIKGKDDLDTNFFIQGIMSVNDIRWQLRLCNEVLEKKIKMQKVNINLNKTLTEAISVLHESLLLPLFKIVKEYSPNSITYTVLEYLLNNAEPNEELCLLLLKDFKENSLKNRISKYAVDCEYEEVIRKLDE